MQEQEIFDHIEAGRHQELYHEWAESGTWSVRYKLARKDMNWIHLFAIRTKLFGIPL